ncbi:uncharacterized protein LOC126896453 isoform X2 [Daktulosphaira vitifoliae]|uniref:uncharacterized protein LOC126896453 isoform X2 n=1 Tax=Daktulosphaira vitifoliae TaxID=58002 RepID=UPI0021AAC4D4|nr:uncharacterized protein LOC126896453 isoform X2 [Daktulosphaira vitifoliae]
MLTDKCFITNCKMDRLNASDEESVNAERNENKEDLCGLKKYLPFLQNIIDNAKDLDIQDSHLEKLRSLYDMVDKKKLPAAKIKCCQNVIDNLYNKYREDINALVKNNIEKKTQIEQKESKKRSKEDSNSHETNFNHSAEMKEESIYYMQSVDKKYIKPIEEDISKSHNDMSSTTSNENQSGFLDSRLRLNKFIGIAANATLEKLNNTDTTNKMSDSTIKELAKQVYDGLKMNQQLAGMDILNGVDLNGVDLSTVKEALKNVNLKKLNYLPLQQPPLPPSNLLNECDIDKPNEVSTIQYNHNVEIQKLAKIVQEDKQHLTESISSKKNSIRDKLTSDINIIHKIGISTELKPKCISALKPGTLLDLENSKISRSSLHIESLRPISKSNDNSSSTNSLKADKIIHRDPRMRKKSLTFSNKETIKINEIPPLMALKICPPLMDLKICPPEMLELRQQNPHLEMNPCHNEPFNNTQLKSSNIQLSSCDNKTFDNRKLPEHNGGHSELCENVCRSYVQISNNQSFETHSINTQTNFKTNDCQNIDSQRNDLIHNFPISTSVDQNKSTYYFQHENLGRPNVSRNYNDSKSYWNDTKSLRADNKVIEPHYRSYKEYREAKYGKEKSGGKPYFKHNNRERNRFRENNRDYCEIDKHKVDKSKDSNIFNSYGVIKDSSSIKSFKIPKIKRNTDSIESNSTTNNIELETSKIRQKNSKASGKTLNTVSEKESARKSYEVLNSDINNINESKICEEKKSINENVDKIIQPQETRKSKKPKKYSKEKEFEKIVKEAKERTNNEKSEPRVRTRSSLKKNYEGHATILKDQLNDETSVITDIDKNLNKPNISEESVDVGHNIISSTSKDLDAEVTISVSIDKISEQSSQVISSSEVNSTGESISKPAVQNLFQVLNNPKFMSLINELHNENVIDKFCNILENIKNNETRVESDVLCKVNKSKTKSKRNKIKAKNIKKQKVPPSDNLSNQNDSNSKDDNSSDDDNFSSLKSTFKRPKNFINNSSDNDSAASSSEISSDKLKYSETAKLKELKVVIPKLEKSDPLNFIKTQDKRNIFNKCSLKSSKPFVGPLSVKLAKQKLENKLSDKEIIKNSSPNYIPKVILHKVNEPSAENVINTTILISNDMNHKNVVSEDIEGISSTNDKKFNDTLILDNKSEPKKVKPKMTELDKLHADIKEMYDSEAVINAPNVRHCRTNKVVDYGSTSFGTITEKNKIEADLSEMKINENVSVSIPELSIKLTSRKKKRGRKPKSKLFVKNNDKSNVAKNIDQLQSNKNYQNLLEIKLKKKKKLSKLKIAKKNKLKNSRLYKLIKSKSTVYVPNSDNITITNSINVKESHPIDYTDKHYFQAPGYTLECKFCDNYDSNQDIVKHYKDCHPQEEILPSRIPKDCANSLINYSIQENLGFCNSEEYDESKSSRNEQAIDTYFTCIFCHITYYDIVKFYDHITSHTGEYRYKCKTCDNVCVNEKELEEHVKIHSNYDTSGGITSLVYPIPVQCKKIFGYLCPFCNYIQLIYNNVVKHMNQHHFSEDKKHNGLWTIVRVNMSYDDMNALHNKNFELTNIIGCQPPLQFIGTQNMIAPKVKSGVHDLKTQPTVSELIAQAKQKLLENPVSIKNEICDDEELSGETNNINLYKVFQLSQSREHCLENESLDSKLQMNVSPKYVLKNNLTKFSLGNICCEQKDSILLYRCKVPSCCKSPFSSMFFNEFLKHVETHHELENWNGKCDFCVISSDKNSSKTVYLSNALQHLVKCHLMLDEGQQLSISTINDISSTQIQSKYQNNSTKTTQENKSIVKIRVRRLSGDILSVNRENKNDNEEKIDREMIKDISNKFFLKNNSKQVIIASINCEIINNTLIYKCMEVSCVNEFLTKFFNEFATHIKQNHKLIAWDGMCNICGHGWWTNFNQLYLEHALDHLIFYHLILCNENCNFIPKTNVTENLCVNPPNCKILDIESISSIKEGTLHIKENTEVFVEDPCRNLSESELFSASTSKQIVSDSSHPDNDSAHSIMIVDVKSLKKGCRYKKNIETNKSDSESDNLSMWLKVPTSCESVTSNYHEHLKLGQQVINNGVPINRNYILIDTSYIKNYFKHFRELPVNVMKTQLAFKEMMSMPRLLGLFKCFDRTCTKIFTCKELFKLHMKLHYSNLEKKKKSQMYNVEQFKKCTYCFRTFDDVDSLANHIAENYTFCNFFCKYCFYRAYTASHVLVHQSKFHSTAKPSILQLEHDNQSEPSKEILKAVDYNKFVLPYVCNVGCCSFSCYVLENFISHSNDEHQQCDKYSCYMCANQENGDGFFALHPKKMIKHFKLHNINMYQCIFCLFGTEILDTMVIHLSMEHFEYDSICLERCLKNNVNDSTNINNLKIVRLSKAIENGLVQTINLPAGTNSLPEIMPHRTKKRRLQCSDVLSAAMKSARINDIQTETNPIVLSITDQTSLVNNTTLDTNSVSEIVANNQINQNNSNKSLQILDIWCNNTEPKKGNDEIIIIDDDDDNKNYSSDNHYNVITSCPKTINEISAKRKCLMTYSNKTPENKIIKTKMLINTAKPRLSIDKLFLCEKCDKLFLNSKEFQEHLTHCPFWNEDGNKCAHCTKTFKTSTNLIEHIKLHGPNRFKCFTCDYHVPTQNLIEKHMRKEHNTIDINLMPVNANNSNYEHDQFVAYPIKQTTKKNSKLNIYKCDECPMQYVTKTQNQKLIVEHLKTVHSVFDYELILVNLSSDGNSEYLAKIKKIIPDVQSQPQRLVSKRKHSIDNYIEVVKESKINRTATEKSKGLCFSPDTIDDIPKSHIFPELISCSVCMYSTKVRSNLLMHLTGHKKGQENTTKEIVNPVPSIGKSELMFDKMINLSASSFEAMTTEKIKNNELNKRIIEKLIPSDQDLSMIPDFVPKNKRYKCSIPSCSYLGINEDMLKKHISILHPEYQCYICPHCPAMLDRVVDLNKIGFHLLHHSENLFKCQYCEYIHYDRKEIKAHIRNTHLVETTNDNQSHIYILRQLNADQNTIINSVPELSSVSEWICNICSSGTKLTEYEIKSHILIVHGLSNMFKCPLCQFEHNDDNTKVFEEHFKTKHNSVAIKCLKVYEKICEDQLVNSQCLLENNQEQQALESIEFRNIAPMCRGIPVELINQSKLHKTRTVSKSPLKMPKTSSTVARKNKILTGVFSKDDDLGNLSLSGQYSCPKCNDFYTSNVVKFREHLCKDINYKIWKCLECSEISDSPRKMAWHVKKHKTVGLKYEKIEDFEKLEWIEEVIKHQTLLLEKLQDIPKKNSFNEELPLVANVFQENIHISESQQQNIEIITLDDTDDE